MKPQLAAFILLAATATSVAMYPSLQLADALPAIAGNPVNAPRRAVVPDQQQRIEVVFVLDTTGSMSGLIETAKEKIWSIASNITAAQSAPEIRIGLVAYRDRGDDYVTRSVDLSNDLDSVYAALMEFQASGGGDEAESVNQALDDALNSISWSQGGNTYRTVFLVGDAPPHMDYQNDIKFPQTLAIARARGIIVNTIQCGNNQATTTQWKQIAKLGSGNFLQVEQSGSALAIATPYDKKIARLSQQLDDTRIYYGDREKQKKQRQKVAAADKLHASASVASRARRALFNSGDSGKSNFLGDGELVEEVTSGRIELENIRTEQLPEAMQKMEPAEQRALIADTAVRRKELTREIESLGSERASYLKERVGERDDANASLDYKIFSTVRNQARKSGLKYESDEIAY